MIPGEVQLVLRVYVDDRRGFMETRHSVIRGGRHGETPMISMELEALEETLAIELRGGLRAMKAALAKEGL